MKIRKVLSGSWAMVCILILIIDSKTALEGASKGVSMCVQTVIPSLFPFLFLSSQITGIWMGQSIRFFRPVSRFMGIPDGSESILLNAFLGGYPSGALCVADYRTQGYFSDYTAARLLPLCNNAGPAFIFGLAGAMFSRKGSGWTLWLIQIFSAVAASAFIPSACASPVRENIRSNSSISRQLANTIKAMEQICGWIILFRILISFAEKWFLNKININLRVIIAGLMELTNGCCMLNLIADENTRLILCSGLLSAGGFCVFLQTNAIAQTVSFRLYFPVKLMQCGISVICAYLCTRLNLCLTAAVMSVTVLIILLIKKYMVIERKTMYNTNTISGGSIYALSKKNRTRMRLLLIRRQA